MYGRAINSKTSQIEENSWFMSIFREKLRTYKACSSFFIFIDIPPRTRGSHVSKCTKMLKLI